MSWDILNALKNQDLGKRKLPILRILRGVLPDDEWLTLEYARACRDEDELDEARQVLEKGLARAAATGSGYVDQFQDELDRVLQRLGVPPPGVDELRARVEKEPDNVRHRVQLAHALKDDHRYAEAFAEVQVIVEKAPYLDEAKEMYVGLAAASGHDDLAIEMQRRRYDEETNHDSKLWRGVELAQWLWAAGRRDDARKLIDEVEEQAGGSNDFSAGNWFLDHGDVAEAIKRFRRQMEKMTSDPYYVEQLRLRTARLELASGEEVAGMNRLLDALENAASLSEREDRFKELLLRAKEHPHPDVLAARLEPVFGKRESVRDLLVMTALEFARGQDKEALADVEQALAKSSKEVYLFPLLLGMERLHDDFDGALTVLDRMSKVYGGSESMRWSDGVSLSERDRLKLVRAELLEKLGKPDDARQLIESIADETDPSSLQRVSAVYQQRGDKERALEWLQRYHKKLGTRELQHLTAEANLLLELGRVEDAKPLVEEAYVMARGGDGTRDLLVKIHRELGTLPEMVERLEGELNKDFRDAAVRSTLLSLYQELDRDADRKAILERMVEQDDLREDGLSGLASFYAAHGAIQERLGVIEKQLEHAAGSKEKSLHRQIANLQMELGDVDSAVAHFREAIDPGTAEGKQTLGDWLVDHEQYERARPLLEDARRLDPDLDSVLAPLLTAAWHMRDWERTIDVAVEKFEKQRGEYEPLAYASDHAALLDALDGLAPERAKELLDGDPDDASSLVRAAVLRLARADAEGALAKADAAIAGGSSSLLPLEIRRIALRRLGRLKDLAQAIEDLRAAIEYDCIVEGDWRRRNRAEQLQDEIGRVDAELGDVAAAESAWRAPPLRREAETSASGVWRSDWSTRFVAQKWLDVREPQRALDALKDEFLLYESAPWDVWTRAMEQLGRVEEVEAFAWQRHLDPLELYGVRSDWYSWIWFDGQYPAHHRHAGVPRRLLPASRRTRRVAHAGRGADEAAGDAAPGRADHGVDRSAHGRPPLVGRARRAGGDGAARGADGRGRVSHRRALALRRRAAARARVAAEGAGLRQPGARPGGSDRSRALVPSLLRRRLGHRQSVRVRLRRRRIELVVVVEQSPTSTTGDAPPQPRCAWPATARGPTPSSATCSTSRPPTGGSARRGASRRPTTGGSCRARRLACSGRCWMIPRRT